MSSKIAKNYLYSLSYQILIIITPIITIPYVSRTLGVQQIGIYSYCYSIVAYFSSIAALGLGTYGQLLIAKKRDNKEEISRLFYQVIFTRLIITIISAIVYILYICFVCKENKLVALIFLINIIASAFDISWFLQALENFKKTAIRNFIIKLLSIFLIFLLVKKPSDLWKYAIILQGSILIGNATLWLGIKKYIVKIPIHKINFIKHIKSSFIYFIPTISMTIYTYFDKTMIGVLSNSDIQNGYYEEAYKIQSILVTIITSIGTVMLPRMTYLFSNDSSKEKIKYYLEKSAAITLMLSIPMVFGLFAISDIFIPIFLGEQFVNSIIPLKILGTLILINGLINFYGMQILMPIGRQKKYNIGVIVGVVCNVIFNYFLIQKYQAIGACVASVISEIIILILFMSFSNDKFPWKKLFKLSWKYIVASLIMYTIIFMIRYLNIGEISKLGLIFICGCTIYFFVLMILHDENFIDAKQILLNKIKKKG